MRIHTDVHNLATIHRGTAHLPGVYAAVTQHGSRSHQRAFEVRLDGNGYARNTGQHGADPDQIGATWDEWGAFLAALYEIDPNAVWGPVKRPVYRDKTDFTFKTSGRFEETPGKLPDDTHKRHNWTSEGVRVQACSKCTASRVF